VLVVRGRCSIRNASVSCWPLLQLFRFLLLLHLPPKRRRRGASRAVDGAATSAASATDRVRKNDDGLAEDEHEGRIRDGGSGGDGAAGGGDLARADEQAACASERETNQVLSASRTKEGRAIGVMINSVNVKPITVRIPKFANVNFHDQQ
jgi:hypothetical protein